MNTVALGDGMDALKLALKNGKEATAKLLLGPYCNIVDKAGVHQSVLQLAVSTDFLAQLLVDDEGKAKALAQLDVLLTKPSLPAFSIGQCIKSLAAQRSALAGAEAAARSAAGAAAAAAGFLPFAAPFAVMAARGVAAAMGAGNDDVKQAFITEAATKLAGFLNPSSELWQPWI